MPTLTAREFETELEAWIDSQGLVYVTTLLETICNEKAEHIRSNWQDTITAKPWDRDASKLMFLSRKLEN